VQKGICLYNRVEPSTDPENKGGNVTVWKGEALFPLPAKKLFQILYDETTVTTWNQTVRSCKSLQRLDQHTDILHTVGKGVGPVSDRDFVMVRQWRNEGSAIVQGILSKRQL
jgi:hypothetical protein